jgi:hypothetical protein
VNQLADRPVLHAEKEPVDLVGLLGGGRRHRRKTRDCRIRPEVRGLRCERAPCQEIGNARTKQLGQLLE